MPEDQDRIFKNRLEAHEYLQRRGYKIGRSKFYKDCSQGLCQLQSDGSILGSDLDAYIKRAGLTQPDLDKAAEEAEELHRQKLEKEVEKLDWENKRRQFEYEKEVGRYIPRSDFEAELAARVAAHEARLNSMIRDKVLEWIWTVNGDPNAAQDLIDSMQQDLADLFNDMARMDQFQVVFVGEEDEPEQEDSGQTGENEE